jgi:two-component system, OmpR family, copper resistance phosphate regulon response regulator CusR
MVMPQILIAEDEERLAAFVQKGLALNGYDSTVAIDGEQALHLLNSGTYDLLLLDLGLPIKDGLTVLQEMPKEPSIPVIVVTALNDTRTRNTLLISGAKDYVTKPFQFADLLARIKAQLSNRL